MRVRSKRRATRRLSLLVRFAIISFVLLLAVGVVLARWLNGIQRERRLDDAAASAQIVAQAGLQGQLQPQDLLADFRPLDPDKRAQLDVAFGSAISEDGVVRLKIWNAQHWIVYSDNPRLVGRWFPGDDDLTAALQGEVTSNVTDLSRAEEMEERDFGRLLAVYVPLRIDPSGERFTNEPTAEVVGAFEIYVPYQPIVDAIAEDARNLSIALGLGFLVLYLGLFRLVAGASRRLRIQAAENAHQATHDSLTDLPNRRQLVDDLQGMLDRRSGSKYVALALVDIDRFKEINDALGHPSGDRVLQDIADRFREQMPDAVVARIGGDEFAIAAEQLPHAQAALAVATRIEDLLVAPFEVAGISVTVHPSIGIALGPDDGRTADELLQHADVAMYVAKRSGSVRKMYSRNLDHYSQDRLELAGELRDAIAAAKGEIMLAYQPKLDLSTDEVLGVECLVRWKHPQRGFVPPAEFLPIIENTELIAPLTWLVLDQALATCANWRRHGLEIQMAVNISARTIGSSELYDRVVDALDRHGLPPSALELELTESALLGDHHTAAQNVTRFRELGVSIAIDDFGTGYASIGYLTTMPISSLKIDRSFVSDMFSDPAAAAVVNFSVGLAQQLGLSVVAEGIEDEPTLEELRRLGVHTGQGYFISRPMPATEFLHWLLAWSTRHLTPRDVAPELDDAVFDLPRESELVGAGAAVGRSGSERASSLFGSPSPSAGAFPAPTFDLSPFAAGTAGGTDWLDPAVVEHRGGPWDVGSSGEDRTASAGAFGGGAPTDQLDRHDGHDQHDRPTGVVDAIDRLVAAAASDAVGEPAAVHEDDRSSRGDLAPLTLLSDPADHTGVDLVIGTRAGDTNLEWAPGPSAPAPIPMLKLPRASDEPSAGGGDVGTVVHDLPGVARLDGGGSPAARPGGGPASSSLPPPLTLEFGTPTSTSTSTTTTPTELDDAREVPSTDVPPLAADATEAQS